MNILFLYTELADYTIACLRALSASPGVRLLVIHYPVNKEAPFQFDTAGIGEFRSVADFRDFNEIRATVDAFRPAIIVSSGWINKQYLRICWQYRRRAINVLTLDNHYTGELKQRVLTMISSLTLKQVFAYCWVPGTPQELYAAKLGFRTDQIRTGFYCCDLNRFTAFYDDTIIQKRDQFPRRFLAVARYVPQKGYHQLWDAFRQWKDEEATDWELWCAGTGEGWEQRVDHPAIKHLGFVQRDQWASVVGQTGVFVLNSFEEPWGVAVHEFAAAGFPMILSEHVGSAVAFLDPDNGIKIDPADTNSIIESFRFMASKSNKDLAQMADHSHALAKKITPEQWAQTLINLPTSK